MDGFKAIVIIERPSDHGTQRGGALHQRSVAHAFSSYVPALAFMRTNKAGAVVVEFDIEVETLDFYDAAKALKVPVVFTANSPMLGDLTQYKLGGLDVVYPQTAAKRRAS
jgi:hypothetical protein